NYLNEKSFNPGSISEGFDSFAKVVDGGYYIEAKIPFKAAVPASDPGIGFDLQINDAQATGGRQDISMWHDVTGDSYMHGSQWGVVTLQGKTMPGTGISLNETEFYLTEGEQIQVTATVTPHNATNKTVTWSSSDENIATVDADGIVTALGLGVATITAT